MRYRRKTLENAGIVSFQKAEAARSEEENDKAASMFLTD
jgi:hypothetical protein